MKKNGFWLLTAVCALSICGCGKNVNADKNNTVMDAIPTVNEKLLDGDEEIEQTEGSLDEEEILASEENTSSKEDLSAEDTLSAEEKTPADETNQDENDPSSYDTTATMDAVLEDDTPSDGSNNDDSSYETVVTFRNDYYLQQHYEKHGIEMGFSSAEEYEYAAMCVVNNPSALHKTEAEDGDDIYYVEETNEFVVVSTDGYIRTYFYPSAGIAYYNRQ